MPCGLIFILRFFLQLTKEKVFFSCCLRFHLRWGPSVYVNRFLIISLHCLPEVLQRHDGSLLSQAPAAVHKKDICELRQLRCSAPTPVHP